MNTFMRYRVSTAAEVSLEIGVRVNDHGLCFDEHFSILIFRGIVDFNKPIRKAHLTENTKILG